MADSTAAELIKQVSGLLTIIVGLVFGIFGQIAQRNARRDLKAASRQRKIDVWLADFLPMSSEFVSLVRAMHDLVLHAQHRAPHLEGPLHVGKEMTPEAIRWSDSYFSVNRALHASKAKLKILTGAFKFNCEEFNLALDAAMACAKNPEEKPVNDCCERVVRVSSLLYDELFELQATERG